MSQHESAKIDLSSPAAVQAAIEAAYRESGNALSWKFLYSPFSVVDGADLAFVGLNPGGDSAPANEFQLCMPAGCSEYRDVSWQGREAGTYGLQPQALALFAWLGVEPQYVLAGNFVPFRSPNWNVLRSPDFSLQFGALLWRAVFERARPRRVIVLTELVRNEIGRILEVERFDRLPVGWGGSSAYRGVGRSGVEVIGLPHLSRYRLFGREQSEQPLTEILGKRVA